jgi:two-component system, NtrC family, sensor histidine kinase HydH
VDIQTQSGLLVGVVTLVIAIAIQIRGRRSRLHTSFAAFNYVLAFWNVARFLAQVGDEGDVWGRVSVLAALVIPWSALRFFRAFLGDHTPWAARASVAAVVVSGLLVPVVASPLYPQGWVGGVVLLYVFGALYLCVFLIYQRLQATQSRVEGARLWYLVIGGLAAISFSFMDFLPLLGALAPALGNIFTALYMFFLSQILVQYRLLDLNEVFGKVVIISLLGLILAANYGVLSYWGGSSGSVLFLTSVVASFVVLLLFEPLRTLVEARVGRYSLRERFELEQQLAALRRGMANVFDLALMVQLLIERFENTRRLTHAALYLLENDAQTYRCAGHVGPAPATSLDVVGSRVALAYLRTGQALMREEVEEDLEEAREDAPSPGMVEQDEDEGTRAKLRALLTFLDDIKGGVVLPILSDGRLIGLLSLWDARVRDAFTPGEVQAMQQIAQQVAIVIENSQLVERLRERDRLAALGEMSAGLAHEIRNPLGAIKGAAQLLADPSTDEDEQREFTQVIVEEVDRLNNVVTQFLEYARPQRSPSAPIQIKPCIERTLQLLRHEAEAIGVRLEVSVEEDMPDARGDRELLTQVFLNLGLNAVQASRSGGLLQITAQVGMRREPGPAGGTLERPAIEVRFDDSGKGMTPEVLRKIFIPFFTTKPQGTGLGLAICQRIIRGFGGVIEASSQPDRGSRFLVLLPLWGDDTISAPPASSPL